jgi:hypothetical protein
MHFNLKIDTFDTISVKDFNRNYFRTQIPVIIRELSKGTLADEKWSIDYFKSTMGNLMMDIYDNSNKKTSATAYTSADLKMRFGDYLDIIAKDEPTDLRIFLCNLFKHNPQLKKEFPCPEIFKGLLDDVGFMFFGGKNTTVRIHYDVDCSNVLHTHFGGKKRVVLVPPCHSNLLYRLPLNTYSLVDLDAPDYEKYPGLKFVKGYDFELNDGDSLYMPAGYWHYMTYLEGSFSVSYRKISHNIKHPLEGLINLGLYMPIDKLLNKLFGKSWLETKQQIAQKKANQMIHM